MASCAQAPPEPSNRGRRCTSKYHGRRATVRAVWSSTPSLITPWLAGRATMLLTISSNVLSHKHVPDFERKDLCQIESECGKRTTSHHRACKQVHPPNTPRALQMFHIRPLLCAHRQTAHEHGDGAHGAALSPPLAIDAAPSNVLPKSVSTERRRAHG